MRISKDNNKKWILIIKGAEQLEHVCAGYAIIHSSAKVRLQCALQSRLVPKICWFKMSGLVWGWSLKQLAGDRCLRTRPGAQSRFFFRWSSEGSDQGKLDLHYIVAFWPWTAHAASTHKHTGVKKGATFRGKHNEWVNVVYIKYGNTLGRKTLPFNF